MKIKLKNAEKIEILRQVLPQFWQEAVHWRDDSWRFTTWLVSAFLVIAGASIYSDRGLLFAFLILMALSIGGTVYLVKNYQSYQNRLKLFLSVEQALGFFEKDEYIAGRGLLPAELLKPAITWRGQGIYIGIIWITAGAALVSIAYQALH